jgi:hypothetical protein
MTSSVRQTRMKQLSEQIKSIEQKLKEDEYDYNEYKKEKEPDIENQIVLHNIPEENQIEEIEYKT